MNKPNNVIDVIVGNTFIDPSAGAVDLTAVASKAIVAIDKNGDGAITAADTFFSFAQSSTDGAAVRLSLPIYIKGIRRVNKLAYAAAVSQVSSMTVSAADVANSTTYSIFVVDKSDKEYVNKPRKRYAIVSDASATAAEIATALIAAVNADTTACVTASSGGAGVVTLTGKKRDTLSQAYETIFDIIPYEGFTTATTVTYTTGADQGQGTYAIAAALEEVAKGYKGNMNRSEFVKLPTYFADPAKTYVTYIIQHDQPIFDQSLAGFKGSTVHTYIFLDSTATASITAMDDLFKTDIAGLPVEF